MKADKSNELLLLELLPPTEVGTEDEDDADEVDWNVVCRGAVTNSHSHRAGGGAAAGGAPNDERDGDDGDEDDNGGAGAGRAQLRMLIQQVKVTALTGQMHMLT